MALMAGADMVIELPVRFACGSAGYFAGAAVELLDKSGIIDAMCFGSEWADITTLEDIARAILLEKDNVEFKKRLKEYLGKGDSYPSARAKAVRASSAVTAVSAAKPENDTKLECAVKANGITLPDTPNNVLGVEYICALIENKSAIVPYTIPRAPVSAKDVRSAIFSSDLDYALGSVPDYVTEILRTENSKCRADDEYGECDENRASNKYFFAMLDNLSSVFQYVIRTNPDLTNIADVSEGLENRLLKYANEYRLISEIVAATKTKRYTYLRIQRAVLHMILGITKADMTVGPQYIRVLGFRENQTGHRLLKMLEERALLPVVLNLKNADLPPAGESMLKQEVNASEIYSIAYGRGCVNESNKFTFYNEYTFPLVKL